MAKQCVFCGEEFGLFEGGNILCGGVEQPACKTCRQALKDLPQEELIRRALASGRASNPEWLRTRQEQMARERQEALSGLTCLRCGGQMLKRGEQTFKLGEETILFSDLNRLSSGSMDLSVFCCENCGKVEFFDPEILEKREKERRDT